MKEAYLIVPEQFLNELKEKQDRIISILEKADSGLNQEFITERQAMKLFSRNLPGSGKCENVVHYLIARLVVQSIIR